MATLEHEQQLFRRRSAPAGDPHVFAAPNGRRARILGLGGVCAGVLALGWLAALGLAMVGAGGSLGVLPGAKHDGRAADGMPAHRAAFLDMASARPTPRPGASPIGRRQFPRQRSETTRVPAPAAGSAVVSAKDRPVASPAAAPQALPPPKAAATPRQGWARQGRTAPPGQMKREQPPPRGGGHSGETPAATSTTPTPGQGSSHGSKKG
jgi:hypothetical protein